MKTPVAILDSQLGFFLMLLLLALASGRLLGVRISILRRLAAAFIGTIVGFAIYYTQTIERGVPPNAGLLFFVPALFVTMLVLVILEITGPFDVGVR